MPVTLTLPDRHALPASVDPPRRRVDRGPLHPWVTRRGGMSLALPTAGAPIPRTGRRAFAPPADGRGEA